jgi:arabinofuranan 3-O-arabinosyltransferase
MSGSRIHYSTVVAAMLAGAACVIYLMDWLWAWNALSTAQWAQRILNRDFVNYWMGATLAHYGRHMDLFAHETYFAHLQAFIGAHAEIRSWSYPPHFLLLVLPLAYLSYGAALIAFLVVTFALFAWSAAIFRKVWAPQASVSISTIAIAGYAVMMFDATQNGFLTGAITLFALAYMRDRPAISGLMFALLTIKPQLGFLLFALLVFDRNWRVIGWGALFTALLIAISIVLFSADSWQMYLTHTLAYQRSVMTDWSGIFLRMMPTTFGSMRSLGFSPEIAAYMLSRETDPLRRIFAVLCGTLLVTPYAFNYDMGAVAVVAALLATSQDSRSSWSSVLWAVIATLPGVVTNLGRAGVPISPLLLAGAVAVIARQAGRLRGHTPASPGFAPAN